MTDQQRMELKQRQEKQRAEEEAELREEKKIREAWIRQDLQQAATSWRAAESGTS